MTVITPLYQRIFVRYARKAIWMPTARSKLFRIAEHKFYSPEEVEQIKILESAYKAQQASILEYMKHEFYIPTTKSGGLPPEFISREMEEHKRVMEENDRENERISKLRVELFDMQLKEWQDKVLEEKLNREEALLEEGIRIDEQVRNLKADPESFVTSDNLERMIEKSIENPVDYEFCINKMGQKISPAFSKDKSPKR